MTNWLKHVVSGVSLFSSVGMFGATALALEAEELIVILNRMAIML